MNKTNKFSFEVRERAVRMVQEHRGESPSLWSATKSIAPKIGCVAQPLHEWVKRDEIDTGARAGVMTTDLQRLKELECACPDECPPRAQAGRPPAQARSS